MKITPTRLRSWIQRYGHTGTLAVAAYFAIASSRRRRYVFAVLALAGLLILALLRVHLRQPPATHQPQPPVPVLHTDAKQIHPDRLVRAQIKIVLSANKDDEETPITARYGKHVLWKDECWYGGALALPGAGVVIYSPEPGITARSYEGRVLWTSSDFGAVGSRVLCGGRDIAMMHEFGPIVGIGIGDPDIWEGPEGVVGSDTIHALNPVTGEAIWERSEAVIGYPLWTNGDVFLTERIDVSKQAVSRLKRRLRPILSKDGRVNDEKRLPHLVRGYTLPVWLELRRVETQGLIWRRRVAGLLPPFDHARDIAPGHVEFTFRKAIGRFTIHGCGFVAEARDTVIVVPMLQPQLEQAGDNVRVMPGKP
jgi:hypothetical protein